MNETIEKLPRFSFSDLYTYDECVFQLAEKKAKRFVEPKSEAMIVGGYIHALLEGEKATSDYIVNNYDLMVGNKGKKNEGVKVAYQRAEEVALFVKCTDVYKGYADAEKETKFAIDSGKGYVISGVVDVLKIDHENKKVEIADWKSVASFDESFNKETRTYDAWYDRAVEQLSLYAWAVKQMHPDASDYALEMKVVGFTKTFPYNMQIVEITGDMESLEMSTSVDVVLAKIDNMAYAINDETAQDYYCHACDCCAINKKFKVIQTTMM